MTASTFMPAQLREIIETHQALFGGFTMQADVEGANADEGKQPEQPKAKPKFRDEDGTEWGFPAETPLVEMSDAERADYYKHKARKHENAVRALRAENEGLKKSVDKADQKEPQGADEATIRADERGKWASRLLAAEIRAAAPGMAGIDQIAANLNPKNFLDMNGEIDADKVSEFVTAITPKGSTSDKQQASFDMGQGLRSGNQASKADQGVAEARRRFGINNPDKH